MNIFILDTDIELCARYHCDRHVNKMILESVQILCTVLNERGLDTPYRSTHRKHPCVCWVDRSYDNFLWLAALADALNREYRYRYKKDRDHASIHVLGDILHFRYESSGLTDFAQAMPDEYTVAGDAVRAYRAYYLGEKLALQVLDITSEPSLQEFGRFLAVQSTGVDLAIHAAGLLHDGDIAPEKSLAQCNTAHLMRLFEVNSIGPLMVARTLLATQRRNHRITFAALSAMVGSIGDNRLGGWYGYRASKTALNQFIKTLANECRLKHPSATIVAIHPGTTDTDLSRPFQKNVPAAKLYSPQKTAARLLGVLESMEDNHSGRFLNWDGTIIPW